jgi:hypothetical protein
MQTVGYHKNKYAVDHHDSKTKTINYTLQINHD